jgi:UDP-3-O-[3-hydroxymyristoyl] N-acetylglucosamine deacetylase
VQVSGFGYWSGDDVLVEFRAAPAGTGIVFVRGDLKPPLRIPACVHHRIEVPRRTTLSAHGARVEMVEHVMAALGGLQIDNCEVWIDRPETPGCDGSSLPFVEALQRAGIVEQDAPRERLVVSRPVRVGDDDCWVEARPSAIAALSLECLIDYGPSGPIGRQTFQLVLTPASFCRELAAARTFLLEQEALQLQQQGLGRRVTSRDLLVFDARGPIDNPLRFPDECVRHKTLDMVGDLSLAGRDLVGHFVAHCSGHRLNAEVVGALLARQSGAMTYKRTA